jgi:uncharacterized SAM-binding protein YcdF (DUF218 family)
MSRRKLTFWALMIAATLALSEFLAAWRTWRAAPSADHAAAVVLLGAALVAAVVWLGFLLYEVDRAAGRIRRQVALYEWLIARRREVAALHRTEPEVPRRVEPRVPHQAGQAGR